MKKQLLRVLLVAVWAGVALVMLVWSLIILALLLVALPLATLVEGPAFWAQKVFYPLMRETLSRARNSLI